MFAHSDIDVIQAPVWMRACGARCSGGLAWAVALRLASKQENVGLSQRRGAPIAVQPTSGVPFDTTRLTRRGFMAAGIAGGLALTACGQPKPEPSGSARMAAAIAEAEAARPHSGRTVTAKLTPQQAQVDIGGPIVRTLAYGNSIPGPVIRASIGDEVVVTVSNGLDHPTSVHWHRHPLRNDMDGAEPATPDIAARSRPRLPVLRAEFGYLLGAPAHRPWTPTPVHLPVIVARPDRRQLRRRMDRRP